MNEYEGLTKSFDDLLEEQNEIAIQDNINREMREQGTKVLKYISIKENLIESIKAEEARLNEYRKSQEEKVSRFKEFVKEVMIGNDIKEIETPFGVLKVINNRPSVEILSEELIPEEYVRIEETKKIDKNKILKNFNETGEIIDGIKIITNKKSLKIK